MLNIVLVHTPSLQARSDFEAISARIERSDPAAKAFIATNHESNDEVNAGIAAAPTLVFSPVHIDGFTPARGRVYEGGLVDKIEQYERLRAAGIATPRTGLLAPGETYAPAEWSEHVVLKPFSPKYQSGGARIFRIATRRLNYDLGVNRMFGHYMVEGGTIVQEYIDTGARLEYHRVLTLFGEPLYAMTTRLKEPIDLDRAAFPTETAAIATQSHPPRAKEAVMQGDTRYLDLARAVYPVFPERALQAVDIVRSETSDRLYVLELNLGGNTWHFSSSMIRGVNRTRGRNLFRDLKVSQFGAFDVAAAALLARARVEAE